MRCCLTILLIGLVLILLCNSGCTTYFVVAKVEVKVESSDLPKVQSAHQIPLFPQCHD